LLIFKDLGEKIRNSFIFFLKIANSFSKEGGGAIFQGPKKNPQTLFKSNVQKSKNMHIYYFYQILKF